MSGAARSFAQKAFRAGLQSGSIMTVSDVGIQFGLNGRTWQGFSPEQKAKDSKTSQSPDAYDIVRTLRWTACGFFLHGPYFLTTFGFVDRIFGPAVGMNVVMKKMMFVQCSIFPTYLALLYTLMGGLEGLKTVPELQAKIQRQVPDAFLGGCVFWPIANTINFKFVPSSMRVPYLAGAGLIYNSFLTYLNQREEDVEFAKRSDSGLIRRMTTGVRNVIDPDAEISAET